MSKIDQIRKKYENTQEIKKQLQDTITLLEERAGLHNVNAEKSAESGDVPGYMEEKEKADKCLAEKHVNEVVLEKMQKVPPVSAEEAQTAWIEYNKGAERNLKKALDQLQTAKENLFTAFMNVIKAQEAQFKTRENCAQCCSGSFNDFEMTLLDIKEVENNSIYFLENNMLQDREYINITGMIKQRNTMVDGYLSDARPVIKREVVFVPIMKTV